MRTSKQWKEEKPEDYAVKTLSDYSLSDLLNLCKLEEKERRSLARFLNELRREIYRETASAVEPYYNKRWNIPSEFVDGVDTALQVSRQTFDKWIEVILNGIY